MRLNPDCIRDILLAVEDLASPERPFSFPVDVRRRPQLGRYDRTTLSYHWRQCDECGYFDVLARTITGITDVVGLSPAGHRFVDSIRSDSVWGHLRKYLADNGLSDLSAALLPKLADAVLNRISS